MSKDEKAAHGRVSKGSLVLMGLRVTCALPARYLRVTCAGAPMFEPVTVGAINIGPRQVADFTLAQRTPVQPESIEMAT